jgi:hypothetical protein
MSAQSEWAKTQVKRIAYACEDYEHDPGCECQAEEILAVIEEAVQLERWACWRDCQDQADKARIAFLAAFPYNETIRHQCSQECADAINARGPMRRQ